MYAAQRDKRAAAADAEAEPPDAPAGRPDGEHADDHVTVPALLEKYLLFQAVFGDQPETRRIDEHLAACPRCRAKAEGVRRALAKRIAPEAEEA